MTEELLNLFYRLSLVDQDASCGVPEIMKADMGKLNDDGSVTYKMTKKQHKAMLTSIADKIDTQLQEMVENPSYSFTKISHNSDFTSFDAYLSTEELGFVESLMVLGFYTYGGMYSVFTGKDVENIAVNYYSSSGELINTANSSEMNN